MYFKLKRNVAICLVSIFLVSCAGVNPLANMTNGLPGSQNTTNTAIKDLLLNSVIAGIGNLGNNNGFLNNSLYKILLPPEAQKVASTLQSLGMGSLVNNAITQINHSAEGAVTLAKPIFTNAIQNMTITDAAGLVSGGDNAITNFFKQKTSTQLLTAFTPVIAQSLEKNNATKYYGQIVSSYNQIPLVKNKLNPDLSNYVANQAMNAMFSQMSTAEKNIRHNPVAQTTAALKQIFGSRSL